MRKLGSIEELSDKMRGALMLIDRSGVEYPRFITNKLVLREFIIKALDARIACNELLSYLKEDLATRYKCLLASTDLDYVTEQLEKINEVEYLFGTAIKDRSAIYQELIERAERDISEIELELAV